MEHTHRLVREVEELRAALAVKVSAVTMHAAYILYMYMMCVYICFHVCVFVCILFESIHTPGSNPSPKN